MSLGPSIEKLSSHLDLDLYHVVKDSPCHEAHAAVCSPFRKLCWFEPALIGLGVVPSWMRAGLVGKGLLCVEPYTHGLLWRTWSKVDAVCCL